MGVLKDILAEVVEEGCRMTGQGAAELAAALFGNSDAYVQYGAGQNMVEPERSVEPVQSEQQQIQSGGMEM